MNVLLKMEHNLNCARYGILQRWCSEVLPPRPQMHSPSSSAFPALQTKMVPHLDLRCVLLSDPSTFGAGGANQNTS